MIDLFNNLRDLEPDQLNQLCSQMNNELLPIAKSLSHKLSFVKQTPEEIVQDILIRHIVERRLPEDKLKNGFENKFALLGYFKTIINRHILYHIANTNNEIATEFTEEELNRLHEDPLKNNITHVEFTDVPPAFLEDFNQRFEVFRQGKTIHRFCHTLLERKYFTRPETYGIRGMTIEEIINTWPEEYSTFTNNTLKQKVARCMNRLKQFLLS